MLGEHKFGAQWPSDMSKRVRLGRKQSEPIADNGVNIFDMGRWALAALVQCVQNGWLPLVYFVGDRRIWYYSSSGEPPLHALYPRPTSDAEGQIELAGGGIYCCMVDLRNFSRILRTKFGERSAAKRGRKRQFEEFDQALAEFFLHNPPMTPAREIIEFLNASFKGPWPGRSTRYDRIEEARPSPKREIRQDNSGLIADGLR